jgi:hypothetical protein
MKCDSISKKFFPITVLAQILTLAIWALIPDPAIAGSFYFDIGGGVSKMQSIGPFYGSPALDTSTSLGYNVNSALFWNLSSGAPIEIQLGLVQQLDSATGSTTVNSYSLLALYPALRIQITRLYFTAGYTPLVWSNNAAAGSTASATSYGRAAGATAILGEAGILWPITPEFSLGAATDLQFVKSVDGSGPTPAMSASILMRFHFGYYGGSGVDHNSNEWKGFRYPLGFMRE